MPQLTVTSLSDNTIALGSVLGKLAAKSQRVHTLTQAELDAVSSTLISLEAGGIIEYSVSRTSDPKDVKFEGWSSKLRVKDVDTTTYTLVPDDDGTLIKFTNVAGCTVTVPADLPVEFSASVSQWAAGAVIFSAGAGVTIRTPASATPPATVSEQYAIAGIAIVAVAEALAYGSLA